MMVGNSSQSTSSFLHGSSGSASSTRLTSGTRVGEYVIQALVGEGGMGSVYSAIHPIIGKKVAIKVLSKQLAKNKNAIQRFVLEARTVNDIRHSGLVDIFSFGRLTDGRHYYVMEFLEGRNLGEVLRERTHLPMAEAIPIFLEVVAALMAVHSKGIVHRDLKPENIILLEGTKHPQQHVKLVDFGLAKLIEGISLPPGVTTPMTAAGVNIGTPHYMSPEQCRGEKVDARSDLYAIGVLLYETLTGFLPIQGSNTVDIWQAHISVIPRPAHDLCPNLVTPSLSAVIAKLLAKHPNDRYQDTAQVREALSVFVPGGGIVGRAAPGLVTAKKRTWTELAESLDRALLQHNLISLDEARNHRSGASAHTPDDPIDLAELARTSTDLAAIMVPEEGMSKEEEQRGIDILRKEWGVKIETPIHDPGSVEEEQMSALEISLDIPSQSRINEELLKTTKDLRFGHMLPNRPIEERTHVPPLAAPVIRSPGYTGNTPRNLPAVPSKYSMVIRGVIFVFLLTAATVAAFIFVR
jgi:serine/threonine protein kinase